MERLVFPLLLLSLAESLEILVLGGTGRIGTAVASHLLLRHSSTSDSAPLHLVLSGRDSERGEAAVREVLAERRPSSRVSVDFRQLDWRDDVDLRRAMRGASAVVHTAGPYAGEDPTVLRAALDGCVPVYVDLSDPVEYLDRAKAIGREKGMDAGETLALCAAGAFPGMSNVLAMECAARLGEGVRVRDIDFSYFTAGLGGSGDVNLFITNDGFGEEVPVYRDGAPSPTMDAGSRERAAGAPTRVKFFLDEKDPSAVYVGERAVWSWPFPEGTLVPRQLEAQKRGISGRSSVGMGTAPAIWNDVMGIMVDVVPRKWWKSEAFSLGLARFSKPLVALTDLFVGETHAMRIDVYGEDGRRVSAVQAHESFRVVVGQSCAEFTLAMLESKGLLNAPRPSDGKATVIGSDRIPLPAQGVFTPEELFAPAEARRPMLERLLSVPGTLNAGFEERLAEVHL